MYSTRPDARQEKQERPSAIRDSTPVQIIQIRGRFCDEGDGEHERLLVNELTNISQEQEDTHPTRREPVLKFGGSLFELPVQFRVDQDVRIVIGASLHFVS